LCTFHCCCRPRSRRKNIGDAAVVEPTRPVAPKTPLPKRKNYETVRKLISQQAAVLSTPEKYSSARNYNENDDRIATLICPTDCDEISSTFDGIGDDLDDLDDLDDYIAADCPEVETFAQLMLAFPIEFNRRKNFPNKISLRQDPEVDKKLKDDPNGERKLATMVNVLLEIAERAARIILPGKPNFLLEKFREKVDGKYGAGSIKRRREETSAKVMGMLFDTCNNMPRHTMAFRTARAIVVQSGSQKNLDECFADFATRPRFGKTARTSASKDMTTIMVEMEDPTKTKRSVARVSDTIVGDAVLDILSARNVGVLSWGSTEIPIPGSAKKVTFPGITPKRSKEEMWRYYHKDTLMKAIAEHGGPFTRSVKNDIKMIKRSSYLKIASALTAGSEKIIRSVDYTVDILINESVSTLQRIIDELVIPAEKKEHTKNLLVVQNFLKYQFDDHLTKEGDGVSTK
jgi:hypothetical protein